MSDLPSLQRACKPVKRPLSYRCRTPTKPELLSGANSIKPDRSVNVTKNISPLPQRPKSLCRASKITLDEAEKEKKERESSNNRSLFNANRAIRMDIPAIFNIPKRDVSANRREHHDKLFEKDANNSKINGDVSRINDPLDLNSLRDEAAKKESKQSAKIFCNEDFSMHRRIKDLAFLASACKRAGKEKQEARAYYSIGVLLDNLGRYKEAVEYYRKFTHICRAIKDVQGEALGYNAIGSDYQTMARLDDRSSYEKAIEFHKKHKDLANYFGRTVASLNLAFCFGRLGDKEQERIHNENAFKYSTLVANIQGQVLALGNLSKLGLKGANNSDIEEFVKKYLSYSSSLDYKQGVTEGYLRLGILRGERGDVKAGSESLKKAFELAQEANDTEKSKVASCSLGIVQAQSKIQSFQSMMRSAYNEGI